MATLKLFVALLKSAELPIATLLEPVVFAIKACGPIAILGVPDVLA